MNSSCRWRSFCHFIALLMVKDPFKMPHASEDTWLSGPRIQWTPGCQVRGYSGHLVVRSEDTVDTWLSGPRIQWTPGCQVTLPGLIPRSCS